MATNIDALRNKLRKINTTSNKTSLIWKPEEGENLVRIVPYVKNPTDPFIELYFHYNLGRRGGLLSPVTFGENDPIVEFSEKLRTPAAGETRVPKADYYMAKKLEPTMRVYVPIIVRGKEKEGVKFWGFGINIYKQILEIIDDADYGDIVDTLKGRDLKINYTPPAKNQKEGEKKDWGKTTILAKPNQTPVIKLVNEESPTDDEKNLIKLVLKDQPDIFDLYEKRDYDYLKRALQDFLEAKTGAKNEPDVKAEIPKKETNLTDQLDSFMDKKSDELPDAKEELKNTEVNEASDEPKVEDDVFKSSMDDFENMFTNG